MGGAMRDRWARLSDATGSPDLLGVEGDQRYGVPTVTYARGTQSFRLGGNGISPGSGVDFFVFDRNTGPQVAFVPGDPNQYHTSTARSNCVVSENGPFFFTLPPGNYRVVANYFPGNNFRLVSDVVANLDVTPAPPPPPPPVCFFDPDQGNVVCI